ncbi:hypothetical protein E2C01_002101 [Portunus trituberculatus]|uniref:Uncharacterized protein n=1 Tax=Portunus trituberculatus TaxID=210409 RepID=A0A5B7CK28_PORTR|nr:hypothetical protein [Portunus trituberculatus]
MALVISFRVTRVSLAVAMIIIEAWESDAYKELLSLIPTPTRSASLHGLPCDYLPTRTLSCHNQLTGSRNINKDVSEPLWPRISVRCGGGWWRGERPAELAHPPDKYRACRGFGGGCVVVKVSGRLLLSSWPPLPPEAVPEREETALGEEGARTREAHQVTADGLLLQPCEAPRRCSARGVSTGGRLCYCGCGAELWAGRWEEMQHVDDKGSARVDWIT